jgi:hypothetical protein
MRIAHMNWLRMTAVLAALLLLLAGCVAAGALEDPGPAAPQAAEPQPAAAKTGPQATAADGDRLVVLSQGPKPHIQLLDSGRDGESQERELGFLSPDGSTLYALEEAGGRTTVRAYELASGRELRKTTLEGSYFVPDDFASPTTLAISGDGRQMLLRRTATEPELKTWQDIGRPRSAFAVLDTSFAQPPVHLELDGEFWFDALSRDGRWLYLIEIQDPYPVAYSPEKAPRYQVRAYDVDRRRLLDAPVVDKRELEQMTGYRRAYIYSADGNWLYSLYTRPDEELFIHALDLANQAALCIDLPFPGSTDFEADLLWSMALSPDDRLLYAVNGQTGQVAQIDLQDGHAVRQTTTLALQAAVPDPALRHRLLARLARWLAPVAQAKVSRAPGAVLTPDGGTLFAIGRTGLLVVDTATLTLRNRYLSEHSLSSLAIGAGGERLYTVAGLPPDPGRLLMVDARSGAVLREFGEDGHPWAVLRAGTD